MAASNMDDSEIKDILFNLKKSDFWDPDSIFTILKRALTMFRGYSGYLKGNKFADLLKSIPCKRIQDCPVPLVISTTNLTNYKEECFSKGNLMKVVQASGAVPMLFKPVEIEGKLYVDGGIANKAPVQALADLIEPKRIIVHFITSDNIDTKRPVNGFLDKRFAPWHVHRLAFTVARQEAYKRQLDILKKRGIEVIEVKTEAPSVGPNSLNKGPLAYNQSRETALGILSKNFDI
jgi:NTE family protein